MLRFSLRNVGTCDKMQPTGSNSESKLPALLRKSFPDFIPQRLTSAVKSKMRLPCSVCVGHTHFDEMERGERGQPTFYQNREQKSIRESFIYNEYQYLPLRCGKSFCLEYKLIEDIKKKNYFLLKLTGKNIKNS